MAYFVHSNRALELEGVDVTFHWRVSLSEWDGLAGSVQRAYLAIVGDHQGEWWGRGNAAFGERAQAEACASAVRELLSLGTVLAIRPFGHPGGKSPLLRAMM